MKQKWYEYSMEEAIYRGAEGYKKGISSLARTSVVMPQIVRIGMDSIQDGFDSLSQRYILHQMVEHGHSLLQHNHWKEIKEIAEARQLLRFPKVHDLRNFMSEIRAVVDGLKKPQRREIRMREETLSSLGVISKELSIEQSSLIRLCLYYSMSTAVELHPEMREVAVEEVAKFVDYLKRRKVIYQGFVHIEELWAKDNIAIK